MAKPKSFILWIVLVVILGGGALLFLGLPAINLWREEQRIATCAWKLRNIGIGIDNYSGVYGLLPRAEGAHSNGLFTVLVPYVEMHAFGQRTFDQAAGPEFATWLDPGAPVGSGKTWWSDDAALAVSGEDFEWTVCPAVSPDLAKAPSAITAIRLGRDKAMTLNTIKSSVPGLATYAGVAGLDADGLRYQAADIYDGMFGSQDPITTAFIIDGTSNTLAVGEYLGAVSQEPARWQVRGTWAGVMVASSAQPPRSTFDGESWRYFGGPHVGLTMFSVADGSVVRVNHGIDVEVFQSLCGIRDGASVNMQSSGVLPVPPTK